MRFDIHISAAHEDAEAFQKRNDSELQLTVIGVRRDGRRRYDPQAKRATVEAAPQPGVSLAGLALKHGVNVNLLRKWAVRDQRASDAQPAPSARPAPGETGSSVQATQYG